jgi:hypothetical protein
MNKIAMLAGLNLTLPGLVMAHPGHGLETGITHFLTDLFHLGVGLVIAAIVFFALRARLATERSQSRSR